MMNFFTKLSLRTQLLGLVVLIVLAGFALTVSLLTRQAAHLQEQAAFDYAGELAQHEGTRATEPMRRALETARTLVASLQALRGAYVPDRALGDAVLRTALEQNPDYVGTWAAWEPNAYDGQDAEYADAARHDATGRYLPQFSRDGDRIDRAVLVDYDQAGAGDYYQIPRASGRNALLEPYHYTFAGKDVLLTTVSVPILENGRFVGAAGIDLALDQLQQVVSAVKLFGDGYGSLLTKNGTFVGDRDADRVGQMLDESTGLDAGQLNAIREAIRAGTAYRTTFHDPRLGAEAAYILTPVRFDGLDAQWAFAATVPTAQMLAGIRALRWQAALLALASIMLTCFALSVALHRLVLRPIGGEPAAAAALARRVAGGDLGQSITVRRGDAHSLMYQLQRMQQALLDVVTQVRRGAEGVAAASSQISQGNQDLSQRTESQASALQQTAASMEQLGSTVRQNADNAQQVNRLAHSATEVATQGGDVVAQVVRTMESISESSGRIASIIDVIDGIAFQTNILALNAAVEAARAGEQGRGFAVVAGEVRTLAGRATDAAREIKQLIETSVERVHSGGALVDRAGDVMREVVAAIRNVTDVVGAITQASTEQRDGVHQIGDAVSQMDQVTQQNAALVEQMAAAATSMSHQAQDLVRTVAIFRLEADPQAPA